VIGGEISATEPNATANTARASSIGQAWRMSTSHTSPACSIRPVRRGAPGLAKTMDVGPAGARSDALAQSCPARLTGSNRLVMPGRCGALAARETSPQWGQGPDRR
jgi:hypothetical protein